ncbi:hypothetical protein G8C92_26170 [Paenibacillus donghaensis]|uniref:hypothetical protein n=1 Tax=Paenibacillus donghaensis TaxID=414771 RepID=UPI0018844EBD|nr:hypothetical protein [Paenibacillus donghaensis]MBE9917504.1 hypothetical protein [Paenibacillus donghaensis]
MLVTGTSMLESKRKRFLVGLTIGFIIWQVPYLASYFTSGKNHMSLSGGWMTWVSVAGSVIWAYYLIRMQLESWLLRKRREVVKALNDEYIRLIRTRSFAAGFWVLMVVIAVLFPLSFWVDISTSFVLHAALFTGVVSSTLAYMSFEKE